MGRKPPPADGTEPGDHEVEEEPKPERGRLARTGELLELASPLVAMLVTLGAALLKLAVERLPTLEPIGVVLVAFLTFLAVSALLQLLLFWRDLGTPSARAAFLRTLSFAILLAGVTVAGMLARYFWELFQAGRTLAEADPAVLVLPLIVSLMVFYPLWTRVRGSRRSFFVVVAAFQNGFFWQALLSGLSPFAHPF